MFANFFRVLLATILLGPSAAFASERLLCKIDGLEWANYEIHLGSLAVGSETYSTVTSLSRGTNIYQTTVTDSGDILLTNEAMFFQADQRLVLKELDSKKFLHVTVINSSMVGHGGVSEVKTMIYACEVL